MKEGGTADRRASGVATTTGVFQRFTYAEGVADGERAAPEVDLVRRDGADLGLAAKAARGKGVGLERVQVGKHLASERLVQLVDAIVLDVGVGLLQDLGDAVRRAEQQLVLAMRPTVQRHPARSARSARSRKQACILPPPPAHLFPNVDP